jgi:hypothetical protein
MVLGTGTWVDHSGHPRYSGDTARRALFIGFRLHQSARQRSLKLRIPASRLGRIQAW